MAGKSTLNRLELRTDDPKVDGGYKKISANVEAIERFFVTAFLQQQEEARETIILDLDATDDRIHGNQEGRFFHGFYSFTIPYFLLKMPVTDGRVASNSSLPLSPSDG